MPMLVIKKLVNLIAHEGNITQKNLVRFVKKSQQNHKNHSKIIKITVKSQKSL